MIHLVVERVSLGSTSYSLSSYSPELIRGVVRVVVVEVVVVALCKT